MRLILSYWVSVLTLICASLVSMTMFILSVIWATSCLSLRISRSRSSSLAMKVCSAADGDIVFTDEVSLTLSRSSSIFRQHACAASKSVLKVKNIYLCDSIKSPVLGSKFLCFGELCLDLVQFVCLKFGVEYIGWLVVAKLPHCARIILYWTTWCHVTLLQKNKFETKVQTCAQILNDVRFHSHPSAVDDDWVFWSFETWSQGWRSFALTKHFWRAPPPPRRCS